MTPREKDDWLVASLIIGVIVVCVILAIITQASCATTLDHERARQLNCLEACTKYAGQQGSDVITGWPLSGPECACRMSNGEVRVTEGVVP